MAVSEHLQDILVNDLRDEEIRRLMLWPYDEDNIFQWNFY